MKIHTRVILLMFGMLVLVAGYAPPPSSTLKIATATAGGVWNPMGIALGDLITRHVSGVTATALTTGGAIENLKLLTTGKVDLAFAYDYHIAWLNTGKLPDGVAGKSPARIVLGLYEHPLHIITRADAGIASVLDLKGKRVSTGAPDSGAEEQAGYVLKALGLDWDKDMARQKLSLTDSATALRDGKLDAFFWSGAVPSETAPTILADLAADAKLKLVFLPIKGNTADAIMQANPDVFHRAVIKRSEYPGLDADVDTLAVTAVLAAMDTLPAYPLDAILGAVFDYKSELTKVWKGAANFTPEKNLAVLASATRAYMHPTAMSVFENRETLYQVATYNALATAHYDGLEPIGWLKQKGNFGIGTFDGLDGEMVVLEGQVYQVKDSGAVNKPDDTVKTPFANVTFFDADVTQDLGEIPNLAALTSALEKLMPRKDAFYAIRVDGAFKTIQTRSLPKQKKPYLEFALALKNQVFFDYQNESGTIVGIWSPEYVGGANVPGYNLHFISADRTRGGHFVEGALTNARVRLDETRNWSIKLGLAGD